MNQIDTKNTALNKMSPKHKSPLLSNIFHYIYNSGLKIDGMNIIQENDKTIKKLYDKVDKIERLPNYTNAQKKLMSNSDYKNFGGESQIIKKELKSIDDTKQIIKNIFEEEELDNLELQFILNSSNGIMSPRNFFNALSLNGLGDTEFGKIFYRNACNFREGHNPNKIVFMDENKFLQTVAILTKEKEIEQNAANFYNYSADIINENLSGFAKMVKERFYFKLFDSENNNEVSKVEFRNIISSFLEVLVNGKYNNIYLFDFSDVDLIDVYKEIENLKALDKNVINDSLEYVIDNYVDKIFADSINGEYLSFEEWKNWFESIKKESSVNIKKLFKNENLLISDVSLNNSEILDDKIDN